MTSEIELRMEQHKQGHFEGYPQKYKCNRLVWFERHPYVEDAIAREKQLKGWSRVKKISLIERENPTWVDLSEEWGKPVKLFGESEVEPQVLRLRLCCAKASLRMTLSWRTRSRRD